MSASFDGKRGKMFINTPIYDFDILFIVQIKIYTGDTVKKYRPGGGVGMPIKIKREDGSCTEYRNARLIPAFLMIPKELLIRCGREMFMLPRTRAGLFADPGTIRKIESNLFREWVIDAFAYRLFFCKNSQIKPPVKTGSVVKMLSKCCQNPK